MAFKLASKGQNTAHGHGVYSSWKGFWKCCIIVISGRIQIEIQVEVLPLENQSEVLATWPGSVYGNSQLKLWEHAPCTWVLSPPDCPHLVCSAHLPHLPGLSEHLISWPHFTHSDTPKTRVLGKIILKQLFIRNSNLTWCPMLYLILLQGKQNFHTVGIHTLSWEYGKTEYNGFHSHHQIIWKVKGFCKCIRCQIVWPWGHSKGMVWFHWVRP